MGKIDTKKAGRLYESLTGRISYLFFGKSLITSCKHYTIFSLSGQGEKKSRQWSDGQELHGVDFLASVLERKHKSNLLLAPLFGAPFLVFLGGLFFTLYLDNRGL